MTHYTRNTYPLLEGGGQSPIDPVHYVAEAVTTAGLSAVGARPWDALDGVGYVFIGDADGFDEAFTEIPEADDIHQTTGPMESGIAKLRDRVGLSDDEARAIAGI